MISKYLNYNFGKYPERIKPIIFFGKKCLATTGTCFIQKIYAPSSSLLQGKHLPFSPSPFHLLSLTQLYHYTQEIFLFSTATFKYTYRVPPQTNWTRIVSERGLVKI